MGGTKTLEPISARIPGASRRQSSSSTRAIAPTVTTRPASADWRESRFGATEYVLAASLFIAAIIVRWPLISRGETLLHSDEAIVGLMAQDIAAGRHFPIYFYGQRYMGALEAYVIAAISPIFDHPITALRMGPALFFAALVAVQYLMLARWFGRRGGLIGAAALLAGSPMFAQWSISARGGYIEILLWGTLLLWAYSEWFVAGAERSTNRRKFIFGFLLGSGFWLNPSIVLFAAPIALHHGLMKWNRFARETRPTFACRLADRLELATLPTLALVAILMINSLYAVWVENGRVHSMILFNVLPKPAAIAVLVTLFAAIGLYIRRAYQSATRRSFTVAALTDRPTLLAAAGPLILGALFGAAPAALYAIRTALAYQAMEPSLPLGLRPLWETGPTFSFLWRGVPLLFGADARPFLELVTIGRPSPLTSLGFVETAVVSASNRVVLGAGLTCAIVLLLTYRRPLADLLRLQLAAGNSNRVVALVPLLTLCSGVVLVLFVLGGCTHDFNTIRYLIPLWAILPGLLAAIFVSRKHRFAARLAPVCLLAAWAVGQVAMYAQLGKPHPLRPLANELVAKKIDPAIAEIFDAHLFSYLTGQHCHVAEFEPFWSRLAHYQAGTGVSRVGPVDYIVRTSPIPDDAAPWPYPGPPPPETVHPLWPRVHAAIVKVPSLCVLREQLVGGYERIRLANPLPN
jgi:uncharacterized membrane protein YdcZ (DUF606 family)